MVNLANIVSNHIQDENFNKDYIQRGSVYKFKNSEIAKFVKFRKRNFGENFQVVPSTPEFLLQNPDGWHPWIFLKKYQISHKKTRKVFLGTRSHFEENKKGWVLKQQPHSEINPLHKIYFMNCSIDQVGVYMKNSPVEQVIDQKDMLKLIDNNERFSCIDENIDEIHKKLNEIDEVYTS